MIEPDDRIAGEEAWELFRETAAGEAHRVIFRNDRAGRLAAATIAIAIGAVIYWPPLVVLVGCSMVGIGERLTARRFAAFSDEPRHRRVRFWFDLAWGLWKVGFLALPLSIGTAFVSASTGSLFLRHMLGVAVAGTLVGFTLSATTTAVGLRASLRDGGRVWVGSGVNQVRILLSTLLIVAITFLAIPLSIVAGLLSWKQQASSPPSAIAFTAIFVFLGLYCLPMLIFIVVDRFARNVVAAVPGRSGNDFGHAVKSQGR